MYILMDDLIVIDNFTLQAGGNLLTLFAFYCFGLVISSLGILVASGGQHFLGRPYQSNLD